MNLQPQEQVRPGDLSGAGHGQACVKGEEETGEEQAPRVHEGRRLILVAQPWPHAHMSTSWTTTRDYYTALDEIKQFEDNMKTTWRPRYTTTGGDLNATLCAPKTLNAQPWRYDLKEKEQYLQEWMRSLVRAAAAYVIPFSMASLELVRMGGGKDNITLDDGRCFAPKHSMNMLGFRVASKGSSITAIAARFNAATGVWFLPLPRHLI